MAEERAGGEKHVEGVRQTEGRAMMGAAEGVRAAVWRSWVLMHRGLWREAVLARTGVGFRSWDCLNS